MRRLVELADKMDELLIELDDAVDMKIEPQTIRKLSYKIAILWDLYRAETLNGHVPCDAYNDLIPDEPEIKNKFGWRTNTELAAFGERWQKTR